MSLYARFLFFVFFIAGFQKGFSQEFVKQRIDLDRAYGGAFSDYLDSVEYIPLQNTKDSEFGEISKLIITDSSFVITDVDTRSILFFSTSGKFLAKISTSGVLRASGALYDLKKNEINIAFENNEHNKLIVESYSLTGNFIAKVNLLRNGVELIQNRIIIDENNYWLFNKLSELDSNHYYFSQFKNNKKIKSAVPFDNLNRYSFYRLNKEIGDARSPLVHSNNFYFSTPIEHKLYKVSTIDGNSEPVFQFVFPAKYAINTSLLAITNKNKMDSIVNKDWFVEKTVLGLENIIYDKNKMIFKVKMGYLGYLASDGSITARNFLYKFADNFLVAFEKIYPDASTYFLPFHTPRIISYEGFYFSKNYLYTHISSLEMFAANAATKGKHPEYPSVLQDYFKTQNRKSNPVIVRMRLKN